MPSEFRKYLKQNIPNKPKLLGIYDDEEERWIKFPEDEVLEEIGMAISDIPQFVNDTTREVKRLTQLFDIEKISFDLNIQGNRIRFTVALKREA